LVVFFFLFYFSRFSIGDGFTLDNYYIGRLRELRVWDGFRSEAEIVAMMNQTLDVPVSEELLAYFPFNFTSLLSLDPVQDYSQFEVLGTYYHLEPFEKNTTFFAEGCVSLSLLKSSMFLILSFPGCVARRFNGVKTWC
jgi:hypothetical protein